MKSLKLALDLCREVSRQLDEIGHHTPEGGVDCLAYADEETAAIRLVAEEAAKLGARVFEDEAGNVSIVKEGTNPKLRAVMGGSHLDAVPQGGQYDGRAGVLIELAILKMMHEENIELQHDYVMQIFRAEESPRFGKALLGSGFATGRAKTSDFDRKSFGDGETLAEAMKSQGAKVESLKSKVEVGEPLLPIKHIGGFREMHIEQANAVRDNGRELGVVTGIRGNVRADIRYLGRAGHTGGEPQYSVESAGDLKEVRSESSRGVARLIVNAEDLAEEIALAGRDIVFSAPVIQTPDSSSTKICDDCYVRLEVRSTDPTVLEETKAFIEEQARTIAEKRGLILDEDSFNVSLSPSVPELSKKMVDHLALSAMEMQISTIKIPSGAGHDAMNMALAGVKTSMYFIPHNGLSHRPDENMVLNEGDDPFDISSPFAKAVLAMNHATATYKPCQKPMYVRTQSFVDALQQRGAVEWEFEA